MSESPTTTVILREAMPAVTLDDALLDSMQTFANGCNFSIGQDWENGEKAYYLTYGCYGVHVNLAQGHERLLMHWLDGDAKVGEGTRRKLEGASPRTIVKLMSRRPCPCCGGFIFKRKGAA